MVKKRWFLCIMLLLLVSMILQGSSSGEADDQEPARESPDLFDLFDYSGESMSWVGLAVPLSDNILVTSAANVPAKADALAVSDGITMSEADSVIPDHAGIVALVVCKEDPMPFRRKPYSFVQNDMEWNPRTLTVRSGDGQGSRLNRYVEEMTRMTWMGYDSVLLRLSGPVFPGSPMLTEGGELAGMVVAEYGEGENRFVALTADGMIHAIGDAISGQQPETAGNPLEGYRVTVEKNEVFFDWSQADPGEGQPGEQLYLVVADTGNSYINYARIDQGETSARMVLAPGRTYLSGLIWSFGAPESLPEKYEITSLPEAGPLTDYGFVSLQCSLAEEPAEGLKNGELPLPLENVTEELLRSGRLHFYSSSMYDVPERIDGLTLLITLTAPSGENYRYLTGWIFDPSYMREDSWSVPLSDTGLLETLNRKGYSAGTYEVAFYVDGKLGDSFTFDLP